MKKYMLGLLVLSAFITLTACMVAKDYTVSAVHKSKRGDYDGSLASARMAVKADPTFGSGWYWLASALVSKDQYDEALEAFSKVIEFQYRASVIQVFDAYAAMTALYCAKKADWDKTIEYGDKTIQYYDKNKSKYQVGTTGARLRDEKLTVGNTCARVGWAHYNKGSFDNAKGYFDKAISRGCSTTSMEEWSYRGRGWAYIMKNKYYYAIYDFKRALEIVDPSNRYAIQDSLRGKGWANFYWGEYELAIKDFNKALENIEPANKVALQNLFMGKAFCYLGVKDKETALAMIKRAKEILPSYNPDFHLSLIHYAVGEKERAWKYRGGSGYIGVRVKDYKSGTVNGAEIIEVLKNTPAKKAGLLTGDIIVRLHYGDIRKTSDFSQKARVLIPGTTVTVKIIREGMERELTIKVGSAEHLMKSNPLISHIIVSEAQTCFNRGYDKYLGKDYESAIEDFTKAIEVNPKYADAFDYRGKAKAEMSDYSGAIADLNRAIELKPGYSSYWFDLAAAYSHKRDKQRCLDALKKAVEFETWKGNVKSKAKNNKAFDWLRDDPDFKRIIGEYIS